mgnify:CR=1 FL=1
MILLVDSGSTKSDWVFLSRQGEMIAKTSTQGMNPNVINVQNIPSDLSQNEVLMRYKDGVYYAKDGFIYACPLRQVVF